MNMLWLQIQTYVLCFYAWMAGYHEWVEWQNTDKSFEEKSWIVPQDTNLKAW